MRAWRVSELGEPRHAMSLDEVPARSPTPASCWSACSAPGPTFPTCSCAVVQLGKAAGARVIGVVGGPEKVEVGLHWGLYTTKDPALVRVCHDELSRLASDGVAKPLVSERLALDAVADGLQRLADGITVGRVAFVS